MEIEQLDSLVAQSPDDVSLRMERGRLLFRLGRMTEARNDFERVLQTDTDNIEARQMRSIIDDILEFRYKDIYNP